MNKALLYLIFVLLSIPAKSEIMQIGLWRDMPVQAVEWIPEVPYKAIVNDTLVLDTISASAKQTFSKAGGSVAWKGKGTYDRVRLEPLEDISSFALICYSPRSRNRPYPGGIEFSSEEKGLRIVNLAELDEYIAGVVEAESGAGRPLEYYKVQAILARTYALKNRSKHLKEGFMLTDQVNCQAYKGKCRYSKAILQAVNETEGLVVVDDHLDLITALYHSNSGGQTENPENVWFSEVPYLRSVVDTFSIGTTSYRWKKTIPYNEWIAFLKEYGYPVHDVHALKQALNFRQMFREGFFVDKRYGIPLRDIRRKFRLNSTLFNVHGKVGDPLVLKGRGFGHGVGMSQEGAMRMAEAGYSYREIIHFYFFGVYVMDYSVHLFYSER